MSCRESSEIKALRLLAIMDMRSQIRGLIDKSADGLSDDDTVLFKEIFDDGALEDIINSTASGYGKYFTEQEIDELISFFSTPTSKKLVEFQPIIARDISESLFRYAIKKIGPNLGNLGRKNDRGFDSTDDPANQEGNS